MSYIPLYLEFIKIRLKRMVEYRGAFLSGAAAQFIMYGTTFALIWIMIDKFKNLNGWSSYEILFLYALDLCSYSFAAFFLFNFSMMLPVMIQTGEFDDILTKPLNPFVHLISREFNIAYFTHITLSVLVMTICFINLGIRLNALKLLILLIVILGGALIQGAALLITTVPSFWLIQNNSLKYTFFTNLKSFIQYPISLYNRTIQVLLTLVVPYAFINFYPAQYFLNKNDFLIFHPVFQYLTPVVGIILFILAYRFWITGVNNYKSTGT